MKRVTVNLAAKSTGTFDVHRFKGDGTTKESRHQAWLAFRAKGVGGSDMGTILGLNPYSTPYDLWLEKTGRQQPEDISGKWAIVKGNALEVELRRRKRAVVLHEMRRTGLGTPSNVDGLGRAYILPYGNKNYRTGQKEATLIIGYKGMIDLARRSGQIRDISARAVHDGDEFTYSYGLNEDLRHVPCAKPGKLTHVYMIANFKDGGHYFQVMNADEIEAAAKRSPSYGKAVSPWKSDYEAMAKKTVIRRAFPYLPVSVEARDAAASDDQTPDYSDVFRPLPTVTADDSPVDVSVDESEQPQQETQPEAEPSPVDVKRAEMIRRFQALGVASDAEACETISKILNREVKASDELTEAELDKVLGQLKASVKEGE